MYKNEFLLSRRQILKASSASVLLSLLPPQLLAGTAELIKRNVPSTEESLSVIGLGTSRTFDFDNDPELMARLVELMQSFFDNGGQLIDSSPMYGAAESVTGELLENIKSTKGLFAATKVWTYGKEAGIKQMERSMKRMGVGKMDLMQIHNLRDWKVHMQTLRAWKQQGRIRYIGITTSHGRHHEELESIMKREKLDFVQFSYNIEDRVVEERLLPLAQDKGIATIINRPYQRGALFRKVKDKPLPDWAAEIDCASWGQFFLKFIASHPAVTCIIPATSKLKHMVDNMTAGYGRLPDENMRQQMIDYVENI